jgi:hypothetical protein
VVAACDLAATLTDDESRRKVDGAEDFDSAVVEAVAAVDVAALDASGRRRPPGFSPGAGRRCDCSSHSPPHRTTPVSLLRLAPRGVGQLVVRMAR